jgi:FkbM family methyltransferase
MNEVEAYDAYRTRTLHQSGVTVRRIVDLGAHLGSFEQHCRTLWPKADIVCVEANKSLIPHLRRNVHENTRVLFGGVGPVSGTWYECRDEESRVQTACGGFILVGERPFTKSTAKIVVDVPSLTLEEILGGWESCDLLKIDIEGSEYAFFEQVSQEVLSKCLLISGEWHATMERRPEDLEKIFKERFPDFFFNFKSPIELDTGMFMACR